MTKIEFTKNRALLYKGWVFEDFFSLPDGEVINTNKKREVVAFSLGQGEERKDFFMKRFFSPHFKDMLFTVRNFDRLCSQAECEWKNAHILLENGIDTYRPVCWGWQRKFGIERKSFFITEKLQGLAFSDFVTENWRGLSQEQKEKIIIAIAKLVRKVHEAGISLPDLYIWHIFIRQVEAGYEFAIIDLHRMRINAPSSEYVRNLGAFDFSMSEKYFDDGIREVFFDAYMGEMGTGEKKVFRRKAKHRSRQLASRRRRPNY